MRRGDIVVVAIAGDYGKPRPAVVVQSSLLLDRRHSVVLCPLTSPLTDATPLRIFVRPTPANGLAAPSEIMVDKITAVPARRLGRVIGRLDEATLSCLDLTSRALLDLA